MNSNFALQSKLRIERRAIVEKIFKLKANGTSVKTEIVAGLTTFFTMAYIIFSKYCSCLPYSFHQTILVSRWMEVTLP